LREKTCALLGIADEHIERNSGDISDEAYGAQKELMRVIEAQLKTASSEYWLQKFEAAGVPCGRVNYRSDLYTDPQAQALDLVWELENRDVGKYKSTGHPIRFSETPVLSTKGAPSLAEHSESILKEFGYSDKEIVQLKATAVVK